MNKNTKIAIAVVSLLVLAGAAYWYYTRKKTDAAANVAPVQANVSNIAAQAQGAPIVAKPTMSNVSAIATTPVAQMQAPSGKITMSSGF